jgi:anaerobic magnesium-protoporphyrin IX monomethyl ester cyclase
MKVLLIMPYSKNEIRNSLDITTPPLGLAYIASTLRSLTGHEVMIHDGMLLRSSLSDIHHIVDSYNPDIVGISAQATPAIYDVYETAHIVKTTDPTISVVLGGAHATFLDGSILRECPDVDYVIRGEGELAMVDLLSELENGNLDNVGSLTFRKNESIKRNPLRKPIMDLDSIPFPAYDLLNLEDYFKENIRLTSVISSRGCPFGCRFCSSSRISGKKWRGRSPENVVEEIEYLMDTYHITEIEFLDDLFTYDPIRVKRICNLLHEREINIGWTCSARADIISSNPGLIKEMKDAGCRSVYMGVESGSPRILHSMRKGISLSQIHHASSIIKKEGMGSIYSFILGYPGESEKDINATISLACKLDPDFAQFTICTPYPGTPLYKEVKRNGLLISQSWKDYSIMGSVMRIPNIDQNQLKRSLYKAYLRFYLRPSFLLRQIKARNKYLLSKIIQGVKQIIMRWSSGSTKSNIRDSRLQLRNDIMVAIDGFEGELYKSALMSDLEIQPIPK